MRPWQIEVWHRAECEHPTYYTVECESVQYALSALFMRCRTHGMDAGEILYLAISRNDIPPGVEAIHIQS